MIMVKNFHKYVKIKEIGHEDNEHIFSDDDDNIIVQEKIDGANFRFMVKKGKVLLGFEYDQFSNCFCYDLRKPVYLPMPLDTPNPPRGVIIGKEGDGFRFLFRNL